MTTNDDKPPMSASDEIERLRAEVGALREALRALQLAAAAGLEIIEDETSPVYDFLCAIHRHVAQACDTDPVNEKALATPLPEPPR